MFCFNKFAYDSCHAIVKEDMETFESNKFEYFLVFVVVIHCFEDMREHIEIIDQEKATSSGKHF